MLCQKKDSSSYMNAPMSYRAISSVWAMTMARHAGLFGHSRREHRLPVASCCCQSGCSAACRRLMPTWYMAPGTMPALRQAVTSSPKKSRSPIRLNRWPTLVA